MTAQKDHFGLGVLLVAGSAFLWSLGGTISRSIEVQDSWTVVFWRSYFALLFLLIFLVLRDGQAATVRAFREMGRPGLIVAACFAAASTSFIVALAYTTVANILLIQASVPLLAALISWLVFGEKIAGSTWIAIMAVIAGVSFMVSNALTGQISPIGDGLAIVIALAFAIATVTTRRHRNVRMVPANTLAVIITLTCSAFLAKVFVVSWIDFGWLAAFGAINLAAGLVLFSLGARMIPAAVAALVGTLEPVLGPLWVWLAHGEVPGERTLIGGAIVFAALIFHLLFELLSTKRA